MEETKIIGYDFDGQEVITEALKELLNAYPAIGTNRIAFSSLSGTSGVAFYPTSGAAINSEKKDITGYTVQQCAYPFIVVYRGSGFNESRRQRVKEWLDDLGRWLEKQPILVGGEAYMIKTYPALTGNREIKTIRRQTPAYLYSQDEDKSEEWAINLQVNYNNEFEEE